MKKLQNNFTNPEQSKRLLELGLPADSADCAIYQNISNEICVINEDELVNKGFFGRGDAIPIWSVGRLIEIFRKLCPFGDIIGELIMMNDNIVESFVNEFENPNVKWDFSKLEE